MLGAGTVINPLIKIITTVAILGAVYLFIVKPALDTTNNAFDSVTNSFNGFGNLDDNIQSQIKGAFDSGGVNANRLQTCIQHAINSGPDTQRINRCVSRFGG